MFVVTLPSGIPTVFPDVAYQSYFPTLLGRKHLVEGNAKLTGSAQVAAVAGPSVAGGFVQTIGSSAAVAVDSMSFLVSAVAVGAIRAPEPKPTVPESGHPRLLRCIAEGLRFVFGNALLRAIAATTATANLFGGIAAAVEIVFLVRQVHASPRGDVLPSDGLQREPGDDFSPPATGRNCPRTARLARSDAQTLSY